MNVSVEERQAGVFVVTPEGDVDMSSSPEVRKTMAPCFQKGTLGVIVDLSQVPYMDSSGIATLIEGLQLSQRSGVRFSLAGMNPSVEAAFDLAHLKDVFAVFPDVTRALSGGNRK